MGGSLIVTLRTVGDLHTCIRTYILGVGLLYRGVELLVSVATADDCLNRGCCWKPLEVHNLPWCYYPLGFAYYVFTEFVPTKTGLRGSAVSTRASPYPKDVKNLNVDIIYETEDIVRIRVRT